MGLDDIEYRLASKLAQKVEGKLLDSATKAITDPILGIFGLGGTSSSAAYLAQINQRLDEIKLGIEQLSQKMDSIGNEVESIARQMTQISSQLTDAELHLILQHYTSDANLIEQNFDTFAAALKSMENPKQFDAAVGDLFELFDIKVLDAIGTAMLNIHDRFVGAGEMKGIIDFQGDVCADALTDWARDPNNIMSMADEDVRWFYSGWIVAVPDGSQIVSRWYEIYGTALASKVIPTFKSVLGVQLKGLMLLCTGWAGTPLQSNLATHTDNLLDTIAAIDGWWTSVSPDAPVAQALKLSGALVGADIQAGPWLCSDTHRATHDPGPERPFDSDWVFWVRARGANRENNVIDLVQSPWNYGACPAAHGINNLTMSTTDDAGKVHNYPYYYLNSGTTDIPRPSKPAAPPEGLVKLLTDLPTTRDMLEKQP